MALPVLFFVAAMAVRTDQTPLREGCDSEDGVVASLPAGTPGEVRFRLSDGSDCFKVAATIDGKDVLGYVPASALTGLERYEKERSLSGSADMVRPGSGVERDEEGCCRDRRSSARSRATTSRFQSARTSAGASATRDSEAPAGPQCLGAGRLGSLSRRPIAAGARLLEAGGGYPLPLGAGGGRP